MFSFAKMKEDQIKRMDDFESSCEHMFKNCPVLEKLLNAPQMTAYSVGQLNLDVYESVEMVVHSLYHAFIDDGEWVVKKRVNETFSDLRKKLNLKPYYNYDIMPGESWEDDEIILTPEILEKFIELDSQHYEYYDKYKEEIEKRNSGEMNEHRKEYFRLANLAKDYFDTLFEEAYND